MIPEPDDSNFHLRDHALLLLASYRRLTGLFSTPGAGMAVAATVHHAADARLAALASMG